MFSLHLISHPLFFEDEIHVVTRLLKTYPVFFHLRKPNASADEYTAFVQQLPQSLYSKVILHDCYHLAHGSTFAACHYATSKRSLVSQSDDSVLKSTSCHSMEELRQLDTAFKSCFLSPIFNSISKPGYCSMFNEDDLRSFLMTQHAIQIIALGGVDCSNVQAVQKMGFDGAAVLGAVWGFNPVSTTNFDARVEALLSRIVH